MKFKTLIPASMAAAAMLLASCSSEEPVNNGGAALKGEKTFASFNISLNRTESRAEADVNADPVEQDIDAITLYIFSGGVLEQTVTPTISDNKTEAVEVTTGEKVIFAIANGTAMTVTPELTTLADFRKSLRSSAAVDIAAENYFDMTGSQTAIITKCTKDEATANPIAVSISRSAAKVQVKYDAGNVTIRPTLRAAFTDGQFAIGQPSRQMRLVFDKNNPVARGTAVNGTYSNYGPLTANPVWKATLTEGFSPAFSRSLYTGESYNTEPVTGNTTYTLVRLTVRPENVYNKEPLASDGTFYVLGRHDAFHGSYVFASDADYNLIYFATEKDADSYRTVAKLSDEYQIIRYTNGYAYYRVNLVTETSDDALLADKYSVLRNHFYRVNVTDVKALGAPTEEGTVPENPDEPLEADAWLAAEISVEAWIPVDFNTSLQ